MKTAKKSERLSVRGLARMLGCSPSHVSRVMRGERVSASLIRRLADAGVVVACGDGKAVAG